MEETMDKKEREQYERQQRIYRYMSREAARNSIYLKHEKDKRQEKDGRVTHNMAMNVESTGSIIGTFSGSNTSSSNKAGTKKNKKRINLLAVVLFALIFLIIIMVKISVGI